MKLHATLRRSDGTTADIAITAEPTARIGDIAAQIMLCDPARSDRYPDALDGLTLEVRIRALAARSFDIIDLDGLCQGVR